MVQNIQTLKFCITNMHIHLPALFALHTHMHARTRARACTHTHTNADTHTHLPGLLAFLVCVSPWVTILFILVTLWQKQNNGTL